MRVFSSVFSIKFQNTFSTEQQWTGTLELKKEGVNIGHQLFCLSQELLQKRPKFRFFNFCLKVSVRYHFWGVMFKERLWPRKSNKNITFVEKERKYFFWRNQEVFCKNVTLGSNYSENFASNLVTKWFLHEDLLFHIKLLSFSIRKLKMKQI